MGPIIPPSAAMIVYAVVATNVSVAGLFMAGIVPGLLIGLSMMAMCSWVAHRRGYPVTGDPFSVANLLRQTRRSILVFLMPVIVIGGIVAGIFTPTEGGAIAVVYALVIGFGVTRQLKLSDLPTALLNAAIVSAVVGALIAFSTTVTYLFTIEHVADTLAKSLLAFTSDPLVFTCLVMVAILVAGMFMESNALIVMIVPILAPMALSYGLDPVYFGFLFVLNIVLGSITPPVGILLFVVIEHLEPRDLEHHPPHLAVHPAPVRDPDPLHRGPGHLHVPAAAPRLRAMTSRCAGDGGRPRLRAMIRGRHAMQYGSGIGLQRPLCPPAGRRPSRPRRIPHPEKP